MGRVLLGGCGEGQELVGVEARRRADLDEVGAALGQRAGLVEGRGPMRASCSMTPPPLMMTPAFAARESPPRKATGAAMRSGHGVASTSTSAKRAGSPESPHAAPAITSDTAVKGMANRSASRTVGAAVILSLLHEGHDLLVLAVGAAPHGTDAHGPGSVDRAREHLVARAAMHRHALSGQRRLVERSLRAQQDAVDRHDLGRADEQDVAYLDVVGRGILDLVAVGVRVDEDVRDLRRAVEQGGELSRGAAPGVVLQGLTAREHEDDDEGGDVLADSEGGDHGHDGQHVEADVAAQDVADHPDEGPRDDEGDVADGDPGRGARESGRAEREHRDQHDDSQPHERVPGEPAQEPHATHSGSAEPWIWWSDDRRRPRIACPARPQHHRPRRPSRSGHSRRDRGAAGCRVHRRSRSRGARCRRRCDRQLARLLVGRRAAARHDERCPPGGHRRARRTARARRNRARDA